ncbi:hypothetical protein SteCoe_31349 [Stentor coeruleus]|uniref:Uncharacterized protein n=1 Tax=Stentor coeruleus TaxID=5963 RepID=A0A1R2B1H5_9CILI|nr:hypothetical protein SteCoe_31349 [Stentor coeruleus]
MISPHLGEDSFVFSDTSEKNSLIESSYQTFISEITLRSDVNCINCQNNHDDVFKAIEGMKDSINALAYRLDEQSVSIQNILSADELSKKIEFSFLKYAIDKKSRLDIKDSMSCNIY